MIYLYNYSEEELRNLQKAAEIFHMKDVELGYGVCLKDGKVEETELEIIDEELED